MAATTKPAKANVGGRPTKMTEETIKKLEQAFSYGCTDKEACSYAGISVQTLFVFEQGNPGFREHKHDLKMKPILAARQMIVKNLDKDLAHARWYATKKMPKEFGDKLNVEHTLVQKVKLDLSDPKVRETLKQLDSFARNELTQPPTHEEPTEENEDPLELE